MIHPFVVQQSPFAEFCSKYWYVGCSFFDPGLLKFVPISASISTVWFSTIIVNSMFLLSKVYVLLLAVYLLGKEI